MAADPRRIVGSMVEAKACHVTSLAECAPLWVKQQDEEGSRHRHPCGGDKKLDN